MNEVEHAGWEYKERNKHEETQFFSFIGCFAAVISALCCATAFAEGASSAKTTSFGTLVLICAGIALLGIVAGIILRRR